MKIQCEYCGANIDDTQASCPNCGAVNKNMKRSGNGVPRTIEELKAYCQAKNMPLEKMRFFIGEDYRGARAFGIYKNEHGNFIVYKNKSDGSRTVRYEGPDEAYAVNELYQKIKEETLNQQAHRPQQTRYQKGPSQTDYSANGSQEVRNNRSRRRRTSGTIRFLLILFVTGWILQIAFMVFGRLSTFGVGMPARYTNTYFNYNDTYYYHTGSEWYRYDDDTKNWTWEQDVDFDYESADYQSDYSEFVDDYGYDYTYDNTHPSSYDYDDDYDYDYDDDWDSDWDSGYDYDDWDSGYTDWDSDW